MKKCTWCGREYPDEAEMCALDGRELSGDQPAAAVKAAVNEIAGGLKEIAPAQGVSDWTPRWVDFGQIGAPFEFREGFSRPNWKTIKAAIQQNTPPESAAEAWAEAANQWVEQLRSNLGGNYHVKRSPAFLLLSALQRPTALDILKFAEETQQRIYDSLDDAAWKSAHGKHVLLVFSEEDDYYQYVSDFHKDGVHPTSGGCLIHRDYVHIAVNLQDGRQIRRTIAHELLHQNVVHLPLPLWLNEGLAVTFERTAARYGSPLDHELQQRHLAFWNEHNIQKFWAGLSFHDPGESNHLSYSLGEIMVSLLSAKPKEFVEFVKLARWEDAAQTAALDVLAHDLGQTMATFLGEGKWRPNRKAMVDLWNAGKKEQKDPPPPE